MLDKGSLRIVNLEVLEVGILVVLVVLLVTVG